MKNWAWFLLTILILQAGCASGSYKSGPAPTEEAPSLTGMSFQNPETPEEQTQRIWGESRGR